MKGLLGPTRPEQLRRQRWQGNQDKEAQNLPKPGKRSTGEEIEADFTEANHNSGQEQIGEGPAQDGAEDAGPGDGALMTGQAA